MRVLHLLDRLDTGGLEVLVLDICKNANKHGLDMVLVAMGGGNLENDFKDTGIPFLILKRRFPFDPMIVLQLRKIVKKYSIDVVHAHLLVAGVHSYIATLFTRVKTVLSHHGISPKTSAIERLVEKLIVYHTDVNVAVSRSFLERMSYEKGIDTNKNFFVIYNGIDLGKFKSKNFDFRKEYNFSNEDILMVMVGNFINNKDQLTVCKALPQIIEKHDNVKIVFIGAKSEKSPEGFDLCYEFCSKNELLNHAFFLGAVKNAGELLSSFDFFIFSSLNESFGIAVIEAMLNNVPVVSSDIPVMLELSCNGKFMIHFKSKDYNDLAKKLLESIDKKDKLSMLSETANEWARHEFSIERHISELKKLYEKLCQ